MILHNAAKAYAHIVERNAATLSNFESTLRSLTYLIPGRASAIVAIDVVLIRVC